MKTFLGFTTGVLVGAIVGWVGMAAVLLMSPELRDFTDELAEGFEKEMGYCEES